MAQSGASASAPLLAGIIAQWAPAPHILPYVPGMVLCAVAICLLRVVPETETASGGSAPWRIRWPSVPAEIRADFTRVGLTAAAVWAVAAGLSWR